MRRRRGSSREVGRRLVVRQMELDMGCEDGRWKTEDEDSVEWSEEEEDEELDESHRRPRR